MRAERRKGTWGGCCSVNWGVKKKGFQKQQNKKSARKCSQSNLGENHTRVFLSRTTSFAKGGGKTLEGKKM